MLHYEGLDHLISKKFNLSPNEPELTLWKDIVRKIKEPKNAVTIAIVGKYTGLKDSYKSLMEALIHGGIAYDARVNLQWIDSEEIEIHGPERFLSDADGILVPGGFGYRGIEGKIKAIKFAREKRIPYFGICLGMQCAVIEFARNVCGLPADSSELDHLLIIHGKGESNTHNQITEGLVDRLIELGKRFDYMAYPHRDHGIREGRGTLVHLRLLMARYLVEHLPPGPR